MDLLVLGGTRFVGRHVVEAARARGHRVTLFHRGRTGTELFPDVERRLGDRDGGLAALAGGRWDAVVDTCGFVPRIVRASARALAGCGRYLFVSSVSVYAHPVPPGATESAPLATLADPTREDMTGETYGALKALCERAAADELGARLTVVRPGLVVGPHDPTDRFTWWVRRLARGGDVPAPGDPDQGVQFVDARDLAAFLVHLAERDVAGVYHAAGPAARLTMRAFLEGVRAATGSAARLVWMDEAFLLAAGVTPWVEMPLWLPAAESGLAALDAGHARAAGLALRPLAETARDTWAWDRARPAGGPPPDARGGGPPGLDPAREAELLTAWHARPPA